MKWPSSMPLPYNESLAAGDIYLNQAVGCATGDIVNDLYEKAGLLNSAGAAPASNLDDPEAAAEPAVEE